MRHDASRCEAKLPRHHCAGAIDPALRNFGTIECQVRQSASDSLGPVINETGVIPHTNLGRALCWLPRWSMCEAALTYSILEFDLTQGSEESATPTSNASSRLLHRTLPVRMVAQQGTSSPLS